MEETHARLTSEGVENVVMVFGSARAMSPRRKATFWTLDSVEDTF